MSRIQLAVIACFAGACAVGPSSSVTTSTDSGEITYLDTNHDGQFDAIDTNGDLVADFHFDLSTCPDCADPHPVAFCANPLVDVDGDGQPDGLDWNCDGVIDVWFNKGGGGGGGGGSSSGGSCQSSQSVNGVSHEVDCTNNNGTYSCSCKTNGTEVSTCSTTSSSACSMPGNCCGY